LIAWIFQGLWVFIISLSLIYINGEDSSIGNEWSVLEYVMIVGFGFGVLIGKFHLVVFMPWEKIIGDLYH
jgi:hypothetical protein